MVKDFLKRVLRLEEATVLQPEVFVHQKPISSPGTESYAGYSQEEYLQALRGSDRAKEFDKMRRSDAQVKMLLNAVKNPIKAATWDVQAVEETPEEMQIRDFVRHCLFDDMDRPFAKFVSEVLTMIDFGHAVMEKTYRLVLNHPEFGTYHGIRGLDWISPKTIERWNLDKETGRLASITQVSNGDLDRYVDVPSQYLLVFNLDREGSNFEGISWLRSIYGNWKRKNVYLQLNAIGIEKFAVPTPIVKIPDGFQNTPQFGFLLQVLSSYTSGEANYITVPEAINIDLGTSTYDPQKVEASIESEDKRMSKAFLANFLELGISGGGAFALSNDLSDFFLAGLDHLANEVSGVVNSDLIPELVKMKFGPRAKYPRLSHSGISDKAGKELSEVIGTLVDKKVIVPDDELEKNVRERYGLPKASDIGKREVQPAPANNFGGGQLSERIRKRWQ